MQDKYKIIKPTELKLNSNNLKILQESSRKGEVMEDSGDDDLLCDIPDDICEELN
jgi:hypothetical protein